MNPEFSSHTEEDYQDEIAQAAKTIINTLNYKPSDIKLKQIYKQAKEKVDSEIALHAIPSLPDSFADSDESPQANKKPEGQITVQELADNKDNKATQSTTLKWLRSSWSNEGDTENKMPQALQQYLQKNNKATGGKNPDKKN